ncbi:MAG: phosphoribosylanthranilate isomerase [Bryobacteraceae bacterium]|nr:phosphoribosylanthranilate isomerase [Bryobacteraceae bacterium]
MMVKICGITTREDAVAAVAAGAHALGFNFCESSPRFLDPDAAAVIGEDLRVLKVGVFVNAAPEVVADIAERAALDIVQLHGSEDPVEFATMRVWKAFRVTENWNPETLDSYGAEAFLLDGPAPGTGQSFDWTQARGLRQRIVLAGGLGPDNVAIAVRMVQPWGVDACSALEKSLGIKDHERVRQFVHNAVQAATKL